MGFIGDFVGGIKNTFLGADSAQEAKRKLNLDQQGQQATRFAEQSQRGYQEYGQQGQNSLNALRAIANGQNSVSAEQLRQGQQAALAQQQAIAAGAAPQNAAMAARTAAIQANRINAGLAGQQAIAGLQERQQAQQAYGSLLQGLRGQDLQASLDSRRNALAGYGAYTQSAGDQPNAIERFGPAVAGGLIAASDRRLKTEVEDGGRDVDKAIRGLKAYAFKYRDGDRYGKGKQVGVMAQDLERAGLGHAVIDTPNGKMVHGAKLATSNTAMLAELGRRVLKLEGKS